AHTPRVVPERRGGRTRVRRTPAPVADFLDRPVEFAGEQGARLAPHGGNELLLGKQIGHPERPNSPDYRPAALSSSTGHTAGADARQAMYVFLRRPDRYDSMMQLERSPLAQ